MKKLSNKTKHTVIVNEVLTATSFYQRAKGLLGRKDFDRNQTLWIHRCKDIHTFFMAFPIDLVFVDKNLIVTGVKKNIKPWKFAFNLKANSVFEFKAGVINNSNIKLGDQLHVGG